MERVSPKITKGILKISQIPMPSQICYTNRISAGKAACDINKAGVIIKIFELVAVPIIGIKAVFKLETLSWKREIQFIIQTIINYIIWIKDDRMQL